MRFSIYTTQVMHLSAVAAFIFILKVIELCAEYERENGWKPRRYIELCEKLLTKSQTERYLGMTNAVFMAAKLKFKGVSGSKGAFGLLFGITMGMSFGITWNDNGNEIGKEAH
ncbi:hypothetical protein Tco_0990168 [Tanacetum coccineum]|uniref:Uncharacterized protein n=1 Tax=Tanacetum coccineum TaxID=301880 RepID=A0ABQ5EVX3_9ASTR